MDGLWAGARGAKWILAKLFKKYSSLVLAFSYYLPAASL